MALWFLGYPKIALERSGTGLAWAKELSHIGTIVNELPFAGIIHQLRGDVDGVREVAEPLIAIAAEHGFPQWLAFGRVLDAWVQTELGGGAGVAQLRGAIGHYRGQNQLYVPYFLGLLAAMQLRYGETAEGLDTVTSALELTGGTGARLLDPELLRLKGELLLASDSRTATEAQIAFSQAIDIARRHSSKSLELRVATSFARLLCRQRKRAEARDLLAPVYNWFTEGFDTPVLQEAKALLEQLSA
jgi:predicted ATPase